MRVRLDLLVSLSRIAGGAARAEVDVGACVRRSGEPWQGLVATAYGCVGVCSRVCRPKRSARVGREEVQPDGCSRVVLAMGMSTARVYGACVLGRGVRS